MIIIIILEIVQTVSTTPVFAASNGSEDAPRTFSDIYEIIISGSVQTGKLVFNYDINGDYIIYKDKHNF